MEEWPVGGGVYGGVSIDWAGNESRLLCLKFQNVRGT